MRMSWAYYKKWKQLVTQYNITYLSFVINYLLHNLEFFNCDSSIMSRVYWSGWLHLSWVITTRLCLTFAVFSFCKDLSNRLIGEIVLLLRHSYSMSWWCKIISLAKLRKINLVSWFLPHDLSVLISNFVIFGYGIRFFSKIISLFWETEDFIITVIDSFSSFVL